MIGGKAEAVDSGFGGWPRRMTATGREAHSERQSLGAFLQASSWSSSFILGTGHYYCEPRDDERMGMRTL